MVSEGHAPDVAVLVTSPKNACRDCLSARGSSDWQSCGGSIAAGLTEVSAPLKDVLAAYALRSFELELTKHDAADLAGQRLRQVGDELDAPRVGIG
jgi:hypothetical protein